MTGSVHGSAIDDGFETLTNAPDAWATGRYAAPPRVDYQRYVEPGDRRTAVDDRCFTEHGAVQYAHPVSNMPKPSKPDQKRHRSRQTSTKPVPHGKRRPSPSFRIRSKDGESVVVSNPFVLRKPARPQPREDSEHSSETDSQNQQSSTTPARSRAFHIRIRGKNGEEAIHDIKRPLHFAPRSTGVHDSQVTTAVGHESDHEDVKYWSANRPSSSNKRDQRYKDKSEPTTFTEFVVDSTTVASSTAGSSVKMSGALPHSSPAPTTNSSTSRLLPPEKPASSMQNSVTSISRYPGKIPSPSISQYSKPSSQKSYREGEGEVVVIPDESVEDSVTAPFTSLSTHCIVSSRPLSPVSVAEASEANDAASVSDLVTSQKSSNKSIDILSSSASSFPITSSLRSLKRVVTLSQSSRQTREDRDDSRPATVSFSKHKETTPEPYYKWKKPQDSLYSISTRGSRSLPYHHDQIISEENPPPTTRSISPYSGILQFEPYEHSDVSSLTRTESRQTLPQEYQPPPRSLSAPSLSTKEVTDGWVQETAHYLPLPSSRSSSSVTEAVRSSSSYRRQSTRLASQKSAHENQGWDKPLSTAAVSDRTTSKHFRRSSSHRTGQEAMEWQEPAQWDEPAEWEERPTSSHRSKTSRTSTSHRKRSRRSSSSHHDNYEVLEQENNDQGLWAETRKSPEKSTRSVSPIDIQEDLLDYLPPPSNDEAGLPPPMPMLTTIYEEPEPNASYLAPSMPTHGSTRFARPGAISPHPLSSVSSAATARKPPTVEPYRLEYQRPYVESKSSSSASSGAHDSSRRHSRRSSRPRMLEEEAYRLSKEASRSRDSEGRESGNAQPSRRSRVSAKQSGGGWKFW